MNQSYEKIIENNLNLTINQMNKIIQERNTHFPSELFKYREINDKHIDALKNQKVYLSHPYSFNDPYDSAFNINMERFKETNIKTIDNLLRKEITDLLIRNAGIDPIIVNNKEIMYDDIPIDKNMITALFEDNRDVFL